jgi:hypothetical protein
MSNSPNFLAAPDRSARVPSGQRGPRNARSPARAWLSLMAAPLLALSHAAEPVKLFDGASLNGWKVLGNGSWTVSNGEIVAKQTPADPHFTHLVQDTVMQDFRVSFLFQAVKGNAGFFFRLQNAGTAPDSISGVQVVIEPSLPSADAFGLYETTAGSGSRNGITPST